MAPKHTNVCLRCIHNKQRMTTKHTNEPTRPAFLIWVTVATALVLALLWMARPKEATLSDAAGQEELQGTVQAVTPPETIQSKGLASTGRPINRTAKAATAAPGKPVQSVTRLQTVPLTKLEDKLGIEVSSVRLTAGGRALDLRYKIVDPEKAARLADPQSIAYLVEPASAVRLGMPNTPQRRTAEKLASGKTHFMLFANTGQVVKPGGKVDLMVGSYMAQNLAVE
jgi:hypothetical protein